MFRFRKIVSFFICTFCGLFLVDVQIVDTSTIVPTATYGTDVHIYVSQGTIEQEQITEGQSLNASPSIRSVTLDAAITTAPVDNTDAPDSGTSPTVVGVVTNKSPAPTIVLGTTESSTASVDLHTTNKNEQTTNFKVSSATTAKLPDTTYMEQLLSSSLDSNPTTTNEEIVTTHADVPTTTNSPVVTTIKLPDEETTEPEHQSTAKNVQITTENVITSHVTTHIAEETTKNIETTPDITDAPTDPIKTTTTTAATTTTTTTTTTPSPPPTTITPSPTTSTSTTTPTTTTPRGPNPDHSIGTTEETTKGDDGNGNSSALEWWEYLLIGIGSALALLLIVILIVCIVKRQRANELFGHELLTYDPPKQTVNGNSPVAFDVSGNKDALDLDDIIAEPARNQSGSFYTDNSLIGYNGQHSFSNPTYIEGAAAL